MTTSDPVGILLALTVFALAIAVWAFLWWLVRQVATPDQRQIVVDLVKAAEQQFAGQAGEDKLTYVLGLAKSTLPRMDEQLLRALVEAAVWEIRQAQAARAVAAAAAGVAKQAAK